jgi:hypothetical protein
MKIFIVRVEEDQAGGVVGIVERVRTGEKERFRGYAALGDVVERMAAAEALPPSRSTVRIRDCVGGAGAPASDR